MVEAGEYRAAVRGSGPLYGTLAEGFRVYPYDLGATRSVDFGQDKMIADGNAFEPEFRVRGIIDRE